MKKQLGVTLIELMITVACIGIGLSIPVLVGFATGVRCTTTPTNVTSSTTYQSNVMDSDAVHCVAGYKMLSNGQQLKNAQGGGIPCP